MAKKKIEKIDTSERDITEVEKVLHKFWDKYKDVPGIQDTLDKNRSRITLP